MTSRSSLIHYSYPTGVLFRSCFESTQKRVLFTFGSTVPHLLIIGLSFCSISGVLSARAQTADFELIRDVSPDKKFAARIMCNSQPENPSQIDPGLIEKAELVALPSKAVVMELPQDYSNNVPKLIWSQDSNWLAYALASGPRVTDTYIYYRSSNDFIEFKADNLQVEVQGDVRNEYVEPIRWMKPGVLLLDQHDIFRGEGGDATHRFAAAFDKTTGKFRIISKKKIR
jgi:hypothetical protein